MSYSQYEADNNYPPQAPGYSHNEYHGPYHDIAGYAATAPYQVIGQSSWTGVADVGADGGDYAQHHPTNSYGQDAAPDWTQPMYPTMSAQGGARMPPWLRLAWQAGQTPPPGNPETVLRESVPFVQNDPDEYMGMKSRVRGFGFLALGLLTLISATLYSLISGRISVLLHPLNYSGLACGWDEQVRHLPFVYYPVDPRDGKLVSVMPKRPMCVQRCPNRTDVAKKAFMSISEASAVNVGQNLALLSVLHSVRSPVYSSRTDYSGYCVPEAPPLKTQFKAIIASKQASHSSTLRSIAATIIAGLPSSLLAALAAVSVSHIAATTKFSQTFCGTASLYFTPLVICCIGCFAISKYGQWLSGSLCILIALAVSASLIMTTGANYVRGGKLLAFLNPQIEEVPSTSSVLIGIHILGLSTVYFTFIAFTLLQTSGHSDPGAALDFSLDPNGGLKIFPLELRAPESSRGALWNLAQSLAVIISGSTLLAYLSRFYRAFVIFLTLKTHQAPGLVRDGLRASPEYETATAFAFNFALLTIPVICYDSFKRTGTRLRTFAAILSDKTSLLSSEYLLTDYALVQYIMDLMVEGSPEYVNYHVSAMRAYGGLSNHLEPYIEHLTSTSNTGLTLLYSVNACIFAMSYAIFLFVNDIDGIGVTSKSPFLASLLVTQAFSFVAQLGISRAATVAETLLYASASPSEHAIIKPETHSHVQSAIAHITANF